MRYEVKFYDCTEEIIYTDYIDADSEGEAIKIATLKMPITKYLKHQYALAEEMQ